MTAPLLRLTGITKSFGPIEVLNDISLDVLILSTFQFGGKDKGPAALKEPDLRKLIETLVIHDTRQSGVHLLSTTNEKPTLPF